MRSGRALSFSVVAVSAVTFLVAMMAPVSAQTPPPGAGTTTSSQTLLGLHVGELVGLDILTDEGSAVTKDVLSALASITGVKLTLLGNELTPIGVVKASQPEGNPSASSELSLDNILSGIDLSGLNLPLDLLGGGLLPLDVNALLGDKLATAGGEAGIINNLNVLGGVLSVDSVTSKLAQSSAIDLAGVTRSLDVSAISLLNVGSLLDLLGLDLSQLGVQQIIDLLKGLGVPVPAELTNLPALLTEVLGNLENTVGNLTDTVKSTLTTLLGGILPGANTVVNTLLDELTTSVFDLLRGILTGISDLSLLNLEAINLGAVAKATDSVDTSDASASCSLGSVSVATIDLPLAPVTDLLKSVGDLLQPILDAIGLGDLLNLSVCGESILGSGGNTGITDDVSTAGGVVTSKAGASAIALSINPGSILDLPGGGSLGDLLPDLPLIGSLLPAGGRSVAQANPLDILASGISLNVGTVQAEATHVVNIVSPTPAVIPETPEELSRTGGNSTPLLLMAAALIPLALLGQRLRRRLERARF